MAQSTIPLVKWFAAVRALLLSPSIPISDLTAVVQLNRPQTVRSMAKRIRDAIAADRASQLLAGLDQLYLGAHLS